MCLSLAATASKRRKNYADLFSIHISQLGLDEIRSAINKASVIGSERFKKKAKKVTVGSLRQSREEGIIKSRVLVRYPGISSLTPLLTILGMTGYEIHGQINANGQVVLVNPNGVFFGVTSTVNVGSLIASGLDISPSDFMNGDYIFNEV